MTSMLAPAKINLYLHVAAPDSSGFHPLQSLVAFADIGDTLTLKDRPGLTITGPFANGLSSGEDNLVSKAIRLFEAATGYRFGGGFILDKQLPLASGIGGGSADAGACLRLLRGLLAPDMTDSALEAIASELGADGPMCLWSRPAFAEGYGEKLTLVDVPVLPAVLINPLVECSTKDVYRLFDQQEKRENTSVKHLFVGAPSDHDWFENLRLTRNDLQRAAMALQPIITDILAALEAQPEVKLARMSGSGATCFALCQSLADADALSVRMRTRWPSAWVRACRLG